MGECWNIFTVSLQSKSKVSLSFSAGWTQPGHLICCFWNFLCISPPPQRLLKGRHVSQVAFIIRVCGSLFWLSFVKNICGFFGDCGSGSYRVSRSPWVITCGHAVHVQGVIFEMSFLFVCFKFCFAMFKCFTISFKCMYIAFLRNAVDQQYITC